MFKNLNDLININFYW